MQVIWLGEGLVPTWAVVAVPEALSPIGEKPVRAQACNHAVTSRL